VRKARPGLRVGPELEIPSEELVIETARSGGPGGQNVNKVASKVILRFDVRNSRCLSEAQRGLLEERLAARLTKAGELVLHSSAHREQGRNHEAARERLLDILRKALAPRTRRRATRPTRGSKERRLESKRQRSETKRRRTGGNGE
jgi:ribosome-associated protein